MKSALSRLRGAGSLGDWRREDILLLLMASAVPLSFAAWQALLNNFAVERAAFTGAEMGILQSLREVPGFLAFAVVFLLLILREQTLAYLALLLLGLGTAVTGFFPSVVGLYVTTVIMSLGYHYYETVQISLSLQWIEKERAPETLGRIIAAGSFASIVTFGLDLAGLRPRRSGLPLGLPAGRRPDRRDRHLRLDRLPALRGEGAPAPPHGACGRATGSTTC